MNTVEIEIDDELYAALVPGATLRVYYGKGARANELRHIRAIVDVDQVVYRVWRRLRWHYHVEWMYKFQLEWKDGVITVLPAPPARLE